EKGGRKWHKSSQHDRPSEQKTGGKQQQRPPEGGEGLSRLIRQPASEPAQPGCGAFPSASPAAARETPASVSSVFSETRHKRNDGRLVHEAHTPLGFRNVPLIIDRPFRKSLSEAVGCGEVFSDRGGQRRATRSAPFPAGFAPPSRAWAKSRRCGNRPRKRGFRRRRT